MEITITVKELIMFIIGIGLIVLIFYAIFLVKNLIVTIKSTNKILKDTEEITGIAAEKAKKIDALVDDVTETVVDTVKKVKKNDGGVKAVKSLISGIKDLVKHFGKKEK